MRLRPHPNLLLPAIALGLSLAPPATADRTVCILPAESTGSVTTMTCDPVRPELHASAAMGFGPTHDACRLETCPCVVRGTPCYAWSISSSPTDSHANVSEIPIGDSQLYLWLNCSSIYLGFAAAEFEIRAHGVEYVDLELTPGVLNAGTATQLFISTGGCPDADFLAATLHIRNDPMPVRPGSWGALKSSYRSE